MDKKLRGLIWEVPVVIVALIIAGNFSSAAIAVTPSPTLASNLTIAGGNITHVIVIMQENRSFDSYFGTYKNPNGYPVAGIPMTNGLPTTCVPDPADNTCVPPYHSTEEYSVDSIHKESSALADINGGLMNGFISVARQNNVTSGPNNTERVPAAQQVMAYHEGGSVDSNGNRTGQLASYWTMADKYLLQDNMFESVPSWSDPSHKYLVSGWSGSYASNGTAPSTCKSATTTTTTQPICRTNLDDPDHRARATNSNFGWNSLAAKLTNNNVTWGFYSQTANGATPIPAARPTPIMGKISPAIWTPLAPADPKAPSTSPRFSDIHNNSAATHDTKDLIASIKSCTTTNDCPAIPQVSWVIPSYINSEHPDPYNSINVGENYVTHLVNVIGQNPALWKHVAIFLSWDDWGGFYDHVPPPSCMPSPPSTCSSGPGDIGYGLRVPGLVISPYVTAGSVDSHQLEHDSYLKFIEDNFIPPNPNQPPGSNRINMNDGRPDQRDSLAGDLSGEFNVPQILPTFSPIILAPAIPSPKYPPSPAIEAKAMANLND